MKSNIYLDDKTSYEIIGFINSKDTSKTLSVHAAKNVTDAAKSGKQIIAVGSTSYGVAVITFNSAYTTPLGGQVFLTTRCLRTTDSGAAIGDIIITGEPNATFTVAKTT